MSNPTEPNPAPALALPLRVVASTDGPCGYMDIRDSSGLLVAQELEDLIADAIVTAVNETAALRAELAAARAQVETLREALQAICERHDYSEAKHDAGCCCCGAIREDAIHYGKREDLQTDIDAARVVLRMTHKAALAATELKPMVGEERG